MGRGSKKGKKIMKNVRTAQPIKKEEDEVERTPEWVINMNISLEEGPDYDSGRSWTIYRVPFSLQEINKKSFIPKLISVGPFHFHHDYDEEDDQLLKVMEEHKMRYLVRLLGGRFQENNGGQEEQAEERQVVVPKVGVEKKVRLEELAGAMKALEQKTRQCYSEAFDRIDSDDFVQMMVIDGCFVVELLRLYYKFNKGVIVDDPIFTTRWMLRTLQRDLVMLENQLPFFVLQELFNLTKRSSEDSPPLIDLTRTFFDPLLPREKDIPKLNPKEKFDHMLDAFRSTYLTSVRGKMTQAGPKKKFRSNSSSKLVQERQLVHSVVELQEAGIKFKKKDGFNNLLAIDFQNGVLEIPPLYIDDNTVPLFLNFLAYEQSDEEPEPFFTNYFMFFDSLINSTRDVQILHKSGIINHVLGSDTDVANLFNKLGREIVYDLDQCYLSKQMKEVNKYCEAYYESKWSIWLSNLVHEYFSSPWTFLSLLAAIILLVFTCLQTFYTVFPYYHPRR